jgi:hypothetical protein
MSGKVDGPWWDPDGSYEERRRRLHVETWGDDPPPLTLWEKVVVWFNFAHHPPVVRGLFDALSWVGLMVWRFVYVVAAIVVVLLVGQCNPW